VCYIWKLLKEILTALITRKTFVFFFFYFFICIRWWMFTKLIVIITSWYIYKQNIHIYLYTCLYCINIYNTLCQLYLYKARKKDKRKRERKRKKERRKEKKEKKRTKERKSCLGKKRKKFKSFKTIFKHSGKSLEYVLI